MEETQSAPIHIGHDAYTNIPQVSEDVSDCIVLEPQKGAARVVTC